MKKNYSLITMVCLAAMMLLASCGDKSKFPGYKRTADGLYYKFYHQDKTAQKPQPNDFMKMAMTCYLNDSLYYDFRSVERDIYSQLTGSKFAGDLQEAYAMMHVGDSASFYIKADSIAVRYYNQDPVVVGLKPDDYFRYEMKLVEVKTPEAFQAELIRMRDLQMQAMKAELAAQIEKGEVDKEDVKAKEEQAFWDYLKENDITSYTQSGLFFTIADTTAGARVQEGQTARIRYVAHYLDGTTLGSSDELGDTYEVKYGSHSVLRGLEEAVGLLRVGEKGRFVLPYTLAYGDKCYNGIPAYSNLVFDVELLEIVE